MYYSSGNYEAFAHPVKPEGIDAKSAHIVGKANVLVCHLVHLICFSLGQPPAHLWNHRYYLIRTPRNQSALYPPDLSPSTGFARFLGLVGIQ